MAIRPLNILFVVKKDGEPEVFEFLLKMINHILQRQEEAKAVVVNTIWLEDWAYSQLPAEYLDKRNVTRFDFL